MALALAWASSGQLPNVVLRLYAEPRGLRGCLAHGKKFTRWCGVNEKQGQWSGLRGGRDQNMKAKLNSEPRTRIMNADLSSKPLSAISNRDRTKKGLGKGIEIPSFQAKEKRKDSFVPTGKSEPDRLSQACLSEMSGSSGHYFLPHWTGFLHALKNRATKNLCIHRATSTPTLREKVEHTPPFCWRSWGPGLCSAWVTGVSRSPKSHPNQLWQPQDGVATEGLLQKDTLSTTASIQTPWFL